ncbi:hypothetical protein [Flavobacterium sp. DSP2-3-1]|uniref:hypothetical protein n=1 Tax=Flavobacterium sp. DSP2-3-1 TaxID=2804620 RepID=UPI003CF8A1DE
MTKKIKFITRLLLLTFFSTFISCNDELYDIKDQHNGVDKNKISLAQFKNETNIDKVEPILSVSTIKSISSKTKVQLSDFVIDTLAIKKFISENNKTTYTFRIYPLFTVAKPNEIYNLVYRKVNDTYETSIFYLYKLPERDREHKLFEKIERIYDSKSTTGKTYKTASVWDCTIEVPVLHCTNTGECKATGVCDNCIWCVHTVISHANCSSGGSSTGGGSSDPGNTSGSGGGASDPYVYSPNTYDNPVFDDPEYIYRTKREQTWTNLGDAPQGFFAKSENITFFNESVQYERDNNWSPESYEFAKWARIYKFDYPDTSWNDVKDLSDYFKNSTDPLKKEIAGKWLKIKKELASNPTFLLKVPCLEIPKWQALVKFTPPQSVKDKIQILDNQLLLTDYNIQYLEHASGAAINLDYFPVTINTLPKNPVTGLKFTPTEFLNYVRLNINNFVDTNISRFSPTTLSTGYNESQIWNSSNPLGAIIHINISQPAGDGSVICSQSDSNHWIFTTIEVPWKPTNSNADGIHPVSGNREFGLIQNSNGTYTFYTRGADRMTNGFESLAAENLTILVDPFANPDKLWNSLKTKVATFVQNNGGSSVTPTTSQNTIWRPDWAKVRQVLRGEVSISDLGCN